MNFDQRSRLTGEFTDIVGLEDYGIRAALARKLVFQKRIPYYKVGKTVRFRRGEIMAWLEARRVPGTKEVAE